MIGRRRGPGARRLAWRMTVAYVTLIVVVAAALSVYLTATFRAVQLEQLREQLAAEARLIGAATESALAAGDAARVNAQTRALAETIAARVTVIDARGVVLGDSEADPAALENHANREEVAAALGGIAIGSTRRHSESVDRDLLYVAVPVRENGQVVGVARVARDLASVDAEVTRASITIVVALAVAALAAGVVAWAIARRISQPVQRLTRAARALAQGELDRRVGSTGDDEIGELGRAFDEMAARLRGLIETLSTDRGRLSAVLATMSDGVVLVDRDERVVLANRAAENLLGMSAAGRETDGSPPRLLAMVHDHELYELTRQAMIAGRPRRELVRFGATGRHLRITATPVEVGDAAILLLIQDVTEIRRAETIRRDFAANVSHELKTPLASIKALVETLEDGAIEDPPVAQDFLHRMHIEVDRLTQLVNELLELARIESGRARITFESRDAGELLRAACERLRAQADRAGVALTTEVEADLPPVRADPERIESAIVNLVHNAIKFTPPGGRIDVRASRDGTADTPVRISVADTGIGIPAEERDRLFERFYKTDKSRASSGTGLGLAIVKHVVQAHGGQVGVESEIGRGSTFWFTLRAAEPSGG